MKPPPLAMVSLIAILSGCAAPQLSITRLRVSVLSRYDFRMNDIIPIAEEELAQERQTYDPNVYEFDPEIQIWECQLVHPQPSLPCGATVARVAQRRVHVPVVAEWDLVVTLFLIPDLPPATIRSYAGSRWGGGRLTLNIYDIRRTDELLVIAERCDSGDGGGVDIYWWNTGSNTLKSIFSWGGEEFGRHYTHGLEVISGKPHLTIYGISAKKRGGAEEDRQHLADELGFPVEIVYDEKMR